MASGGSVDEEPTPPGHPAPESAQVEANVPAQPAPAPTPFDVLMQRFDAIDKRLDQQGTAIVKIAELVTAPQAQQTAQAPGLMGLINSFAPALRDAFSGGGDNDLYIRVGKSVVDGALDGTIKRVVRAAGTEGARHVTGLG